MVSPGQPLVKLVGNAALSDVAQQAIASFMVLLPCSMVVRGFHVHAIHGVALGEVLWGTIPCRICDQDE